MECTVMDITTSLSPQQAKAQRQHGWRHDERSVVIHAAREVAQQLFNPPANTPDIIVRAWAAFRPEILDLLGDLNTTQIDAERHDGDTRNGHELLEAYLDALRSARDTPTKTATQIRRWNAYTGTINALRTTARAGLAVVRADIAKTKELLMGPR